MKQQRRADGSSVYSIPCFSGNALNPSYHNELKQLLTDRGLDEYREITIYNEEARIVYKKSGKLITATNKLLKQLKG